MQLDINLILQVVTLLSVLGGLFKMWFEHKHRIESLEKKNIEQETNKEKLELRLDKIDSNIAKINEYIIREESKQRFADMLVNEFQKHSRSVVQELNTISKHFKQ